MPPVRMILPLALALALALVCCATARSQFKDEAPAHGVRFGAARTHKYRVGVRITAVGGSCKGLYATIPVPMDWPEQEVHIVGEDFSPTTTKVRYRTLDKGVEQMLVTIPLLHSGAEAHALVTYEIRRRAILPPADPTGLEIPRRVERAVKFYLGPSPYIESRNARIRSLAKEITAEKEPAWTKVEAIYDYVREHVEYRGGPLKGALRALRDGYGDCEELSSLFIALCRAAGVPARTVWIPGHCYPEFYLVDGQKTGHWFPCQAAGTRAFGQMSEDRPVLQKGDNFRVPEKPRDRQRYVAEFLRGTPGPGSGKPKVQFVRELLPN